MHPAWSIIFFTCVSGLGLGLAGCLVIGLIHLTSIHQIIVVGCLTFALIGSGLMSSTLHLGHPERAWRALTQWRSSWLSREGVLAILVLGCLSLWFLHCSLIGPTPVWFNFLVLALVVATVYATSMIYASLRTVFCWYSHLTPACYLAFSASGGMLIALLLINVFEQETSYLHWICVVILGASWACKLFWWRRLDNGGNKSNLATATGLGSFGEVRSLMHPHTSENYLQKEMGFKIARRHAMKLRLIAVTFGAFIPIIFSIAFPYQLLACFFAVISHICGMFIERWLFFAEAKHVVSLYYGETH